jgi:hypothetical protein
LYRNANANKTPNTKTKNLLEKIPPTQSPDRNAARFKAGAERLSMPEVPEAEFVAAVEAAVRANAVRGRVGFECGFWRGLWLWLAPSRQLAMRGRRF